MKFLISILLTLGLWCQVSYAAPRPALVRIHTEDRDGSFSHGSGTCVGWDLNHGLIMTAWHVVKDNTGQITIDFFIDKQVYTLKAEIAAVNSTWDLAALVVKRPLGFDCPFISLGQTPPEIGDKITVAGFGSRGLATYREVTGATLGFCAPSPVAAYDLMFVAARARDGDSGGALLFEDGRLAGVLFGSKNATHGAHCVRVRKFLRAQVEGKYPSLIHEILRIYPMYQPR